MIQINMPVQGSIIGIDLGTTNSIMAYAKQGKASILENVSGQRLTPSVVAYKEDGTVFVGQEAKRQAVVNPRNTFSSFKRYLGRTKIEMAQPKTRVTITFMLTANNQGIVAFYIPVLERSIVVEELSSHLLRLLINSARKQLGDDLHKAVITVPAYFSNAQRTGTTNAGKIAGIEVVRIVNEPTAGVFGYISQCQGKISEYEIESVCYMLAVFDLGGGTFDVSVVESDLGVVEVKTSCGDVILGGDDFDNMIFNWICKYIRLETGLEIDSFSNHSRIKRVVQTAEIAKIELSTLQQTYIRLPFLAFVDDDVTQFEDIIDSSESDSGFLVVTIKEIGQETLGKIPKGAHFSRILTR